MATEFVGRSGHYVKQSEDYRAFIPATLPPDPPVQMDDELITLLSKADRALGRLDGSTETLPNPDLFVFMYVRKEAVLSSQIEGTQSTLMDVLEYEASVREAGQPHDVNEVINYIAALNYGLERLNTLPLSLRLIKELHARLLTGVRGGTLTPGEFCQSQNWVGGSSPSAARYVPPPVPAMGEALGQLETFIYNERPMPALIKIGLVHAQFETIHPFLDGNGRIGRLLITFLLCQQEILTRPLLYLSYYFKQNRTEYYDRLQAIRDKGDWESWLKFFLRGVFVVSQEAASKARQIVNLREEHRHLITDKFGRSAGRSLLLLETLFEQPFVNIQGVSDRLNLSFANASTLVKRLCDYGILKETTGQRRNRVFAYASYISLFSDDEVPEPHTVIET